MPRTRAEYCWPLADKAMLAKMREIGCSYKAIGVQLGRTPAACGGMYNSLQRLGVVDQVTERFTVDEHTGIGPLLGMKKKGYALVAIERHGSECSVTWEKNR